MNDLQHGDERFVRHVHAPPHLFRAGATYFVTAHQVECVAATARDERKQELLGSIEFAARQRSWDLLAWVVLSNHYHCILKAPEQSKHTIGELLKLVHRYTSLRWNRADGVAGRTVWYQYWDTCLTSVGSFFARVNYIHFNPVKHGLVRDPAEYPFSSYSHWHDREDLDLHELEQVYPWDRLDLEGPRRPR